MTGDNPLKLQSRLLAAILAVALLPLFVLGILLYSSYRFDLSQAVQHHLQSVAAIQQSRLSAILRQNEERLALVASRTQLRLSLERYLLTRDPADQVRMTRILEDAAGSIDDLENISVYSPDGIVVASTDSSRVGAAHFDPELFALSRSTPVVDRIYLDGQGQPRVLLCGPMTREGRNLGVVVIRSQVQNLMASLFDYAGLGETGETILARPAARGGYVFLAPTRFAPGATLEKFTWNGEPDPADAAFLAAEGQAAVRDYRQVPVLAVARRVPRTDWVLVVKIDREEAFQGVDRTAWLALVLFGLLTATIVLVAVRLARRLSAPLVQLADAAGAIAEGRYGHQVPVPDRPGDEIGVLVGSFNFMSQEVARAQAALETKIEELGGAMSEIRSLKGILPICSSCKKIRDDQGYWNQLESYLRDHGDLEFTHGICPECYRRMEDDLEKELPEAP